MADLWQILDFTDVPFEMRAGVNKQLERVRHLVPPWCAKIRVYYNPKPAEHEQNSRASITISPEYRCATLNILPVWLDASEEHRYQALVHEIAHFPSRQLHDLAYTIAQHAVADEKMRQILYEQIRVATEAATEDTAQMILRGEAKL